MRKKHIVTYPISKIYHIDDLVKCYQYTSQGHFFDEGTMRFFKSRLTSDFIRLNDNEFIFRTTEKAGFTDPTRVSSIRKATVMKCGKKANFYKFKIEIDTIQHGVSHSTAKATLRQIKKDAGLYPYNKKASEL